MDDGTKFARAIEKCLCRLTGLDYDDACTCNDVVRNHYDFEGYPEEQVRVTGAVPNDHTAF